MNKFLALAFLTLGIAVSGCSSDDPVFPAPPQGSSPPPPPPPPPPAPADVSGSWVTRIVNNAVNCGLGEIIDAQTLAITQNGVDATLTTSAGAEYTGTVNGDIVTWTGSYDWRGGTATFTSATITVAGDSASGNAAWTWTDGTDSCNGTMDISVVRNGSTEEVSPNSAPNIANVFQFVDGVSFFHGTVHAVSDNADFFTFSAVADGFVEAELSGFDPATSNLDLEVLSQNQSLIVRSNSTDSFEMAGFWVQAGRTYYIGVKAISTPGGDQPYSLAIDVN
jgi:hypothetical protein